MMTKIEASFFELFRIALECHISHQHNLPKAAWEAILSISQRQAVAGVVFSAIEQLSEKGQSIPKSLLFEWLGLNEQIKQRNLLLNLRCKELERLLSEEGFRCCVLKGQGTALYYNHPERRQSGDIDIWVEGTRKEIKRVVRDKVGDTFEIAHHIAFPMFEDADVEVHFIPGEMCNPFMDRRLQKYYFVNRPKQMSNEVSLKDTENQINVPTKHFNAIFQLSHIMYHFFIEGVGLRHFIDYYYLLQQGFSHDEKVDFKLQIEKLGMTDFAKSVMWVEKCVLGLDEKYLLLPTYEKGGRLLLEEILATGNMGHYDTRYNFRHRGLIARGIADTFRDLKLAYVFPSEGLFKPLQKIFNQKWKIKQILKKV